LIPGELRQDFVNHRLEPARNNTRPRFLSGLLMIAVRIYDHDYVFLEQEIGTKILDKNYIEC
jgi:hypothetical protein